MKRNNNRKNKQDFLLRMDIGERLRLLRGNLSQQEFGDLVEIPQRKLSRFETGKAPIDLISTQKICKRMKVTSDWLLFGTGSTPPEESTCTPQSDVVETSNACARCLELYERLCAAQDRERILLKENGELREELAALKNSLASAREAEKQLKIS